MGPATRNLKQTVTYWAPAAIDGWGQPGFAAPVKLRGRWSENQETVTLGSGEEYVAKSVVWLAIAVEKGGYLALGDFATDPIASPQSVPGAREIQAYREIPDLRNLEQERRAFL